MEYSTLPVPPGERSSGWLVPLTATPAPGVAIGVDHSDRRELREPYRLDTWTIARDLEARSVTS